MIGEVEANRVLTTGLAGPGQKVGSSIVYDVGTLAELPRLIRRSDETGQRRRCSAQAAQTAAGAGKVGYSTPEID